MRKLLFLVLAFSAGVLTLAWINSRPARRSAPRRPHAGPDDTPHRERARPRSTTPSRETSAPRASSTEPRRCAGTTASGKRCSREAQEGSRFCWQHG